MGAANEKPRLQKQPGSPSYASRTHPSKCRVSESDCDDDSMLSLTCLRR